MKRLTYTKDSLHLTEFAIEYAGKWHTYARDTRTLKAVKRALDLGRIETNEFNQFRLKEFESPLLNGENKGFTIKKN